MPTRRFTEEQLTDLILRLSDFDHPKELADIQDELLDLVLAHRSIIPRLTSARRKVKELGHQQRDLQNKQRELKQANRKLTKNRNTALASVLEDAVASDVFSYLTIKVDNFRSANHITLVDQAGRVGGDLNPQDAAEVFTAYLTGKIKREEPVSVFGRNTKFPDASIS
jgi:chromosome segregation ATPase